MLWDYKTMITKKETAKNKHLEVKLYVTKQPIDHRINQRWNKKHTFWTSKNENEMIKTEAKPKKKMWLIATQAFFKKWQKFKTIKIYPSIN